VDLIGLLVGDLEAEFLLAKWSDFCSAAIFSEEKDWGAYLLDGHHHLDGVQAVKTEVVGEVGGAVDLMVDRC
jgi:hypothetical protein